MTGSGIARDAALRGLTTLLVEKEDFSYGTTSRSTRLIHGGLRYLRTFEFKLVWQDLHEREVLLHIAPHLVNKLEFTIPLLRSEPLYRFSLPFGLCLYDILALGKSLPSRKHYSLKKTLEAEPVLADVSDLVGSYSYFDCQARNMERLCLENAISADAKGSVLLNHTEATDFIYQDGTISGIRLRDQISGKTFTARGRMTVNAGGPWANTVWNKLNIGQKFNLRRTKGIHLLTRKIANKALVLFAKSDGRLFFIIPWHNWSLIGTTDTDYLGDPDKVGAEKADVDYLVKETQHYFPKFKQEEVCYTMAGLRPLASRGEKAESNTTRAHKLIDHEKTDKVRGLISILGGKITAYRAIAEETTDLVCKKLKVAERCTTSEIPLPGSPGVNQAEIAKIAEQKGLPVEAVNNLADIYGSRLNSVLVYVDQDKSLGNFIYPGFPDIRAQIKHAVLEESALTINDFMLRRSLMGLSPTQGREAVEAVAGELSKLLEWSMEEKQKQLGEYFTATAIGQAFHK